MACLLSLGCHQEPSVSHGKNGNPKAPVIRQASELTLIGVRTCVRFPAEPDRSRAASEGSRDQVAPGNGSHLSAGSQRCWESSGIPWHRRPPLGALPCRGQTLAGLFYQKRDYMSTPNSTIRKIKFPENRKKSAALFCFNLFVFSKNPGICAGSSKSFQKAFSAADSMLFFITLPEADCSASPRSDAVPCVPGRSKARVFGSTRPLRRSLREN